jgi:hypothetical protein
MVVALDSLAYARHVREHGVPQDQTEAHPEAARTLIMNELMIKEESRVGIDELRRAISRPR